MEQSLLQENNSHILENLKNELKISEAKVNFLTEEVSNLKEMLLELKRNRFGTKSERWQSEEQLVFNEAEIESKKPEEELEPSDEKIEIKAHTKGRGKRKPLPEDLPREIVKIELPEEECFSEDGSPLKIIGYEVSEKLDYIPSKTKVIQYHRAKYGQDSGDYEKTAQPVPSVIPKGIAEPSLLAAIIVGKFADALPLYRQEEILGRQNIIISRTTMARWMITVSKALQPIWNVLSDRLKDSFYISCDETRIQVLKEKGRRAESKSWMWVRSTPYGENKIILFDYSPSRAGSVASEVLDDFKGFLQVDGYAGYNEFCKQEGVKRLGCNMHARRYFEKATKVGAKAGKTLGAVAMNFYKELYLIEDELRNEPLDIRFNLRLKLAKSIWDKFKKWVNENKNKVPSSSKIGKAFGYFISEHEYLIGYLQDGRLEMDSGFVERCIRKFTIGRNNWVFSDTEDGAEASALLYSLVITMKTNKVNPYEALTYILKEIPKIQSLEGIESLVDIIVAAQPVSVKKA